MAQHCNLLHGVALTMEVLPSVVASASGSNEICYRYFPADALPMDIDVINTFSFFLLVMVK
jgi:hypothetical protein